MTFEELLEKTFVAWEDDYRARPNEFLTQEEANEMELATLGQKQRIAFIAYARQLGLKVESISIVAVQKGGSDDDQRPVPAE